MESTHQLPPHISLVQTTHKKNDVEKWHIVCEVSWTLDRVEVIAWNLVSTEFELKKFTSAIKKPKYEPLCLTILHNMKKPGS